MNKVWVAICIIGGFGLLLFSGIPHFVDIVKQISSQTDEILADILPVSSADADEAYARSIELLSAGKQWEAEDVIEAALRRNPNDRKILFAHAVLKRSRWSKLESTKLFAECSKGNDYLALASQLALLLDLHEGVDERMKDLVVLSDEYPDDVYLLWLSAIECREQEMGELGKERYELLLSKFDIGPVLLHQSYANILDEQLHDYEAALVHRKIAVSMESAVWALQGLANTLTDTGKYLEAVEQWEKLVREVPDDDYYWYRYAFSLVNLERFAEAVDAYEKAVELDAGYSGYWRQLGECHEALGHVDDALACYQKAAALGADITSELAEHYILQNKSGDNVELTELVRQKMLQDAEFLKGLSKESYRATAVRLADGTDMITSCQRLDRMVSVCEEEGRIDLAVATQERLVALAKSLDVKQDALDILEARLKELESILEKNVDGV